MAEIAGCDLFEELLLECNVRRKGKRFRATEVSHSPDKYKLDYS